MAVYHRRSIFHKRVHTKLHSHTHTLVLRSNDDASAPLYSFSLDSLSLINGPQMIDATCIKQPMLCGRLLLPHLFPTAYCNGLFLVSSFDNKNVWAICNPLTNEFHELPNSNANASVSGYDFSLCDLGFGYDHVADDYKVVEIDKLASEGNFVYQTLIYSLKSGFWRKIENCPCSPRGVPRWDAFLKGAFLEGTLYWISEDLIIALDLETETYSQLPLPPVDRSEFHNLLLDSLDGCLICSLHHRPTHLFDGWVMKNNGVEKSWVKLFSLEYFCCMELWLVAYLKRKEQVILQHDLGFVWFDVGNSPVKELSIHTLPNITPSQIFQGSLVRFNGRDVGAKRKRKTKRVDRRLEFCVRNAGEWCGNNSCRQDLLTG